MSQCWPDSAPHGLRFPPWRISPFPRTQHWPGCQKMRSRNSAPAASTLHKPGIAVCSSPTPTMPTPITCLAASLSIRSAQGRRCRVCAGPPRRCQTGLSSSIDCLKPAVWPAGPRKRRQSNLRRSKAPQHPALGIYQLAMRQGVQPAAGEQALGAARQQLADQAPVRPQHQPISEVDVAPHGALDQFSGAFELTAGHGGPDIVIFLIL